MPLTRCSTLKPTALLVISSVLGVTFSAVMDFNTGNFIGRFALAPLSVSHCRDIKSFWMTSRRTLLHDGLYACCCF